MTQNEEFNKIVSTSLIEAANIVEAVNKTANDYDARDQVRMILERILIEWEKQNQTRKQHPYPTHP